jgi:hypothetical protein
MNLLISIIGDSFDRAQNQIQQDSLFERVNILARINRELEPEVFGYLLFADEQELVLKGMVEEEGESMRRKLDCIQKALE